jgi:hypothetical protein
MSVDLFSAFAVDTNQEQEGTLTQLPNAGDTKFRIAREGNKAYSKLLQKLVKMNRAVLDSKGAAAEAKSDEILIEVMAKTILIGWEGEITYQGKKLAYSVEAAKTLLAHKDFRAVVINASSDMEKFKVVKDEEDAKN